MLALFSLSHRATLEILSKATLPKESVTDNLLLAAATAAESFNPENSSLSSTSSPSSLLQTPPRQLPSTPSPKTPFSFKHQDLSSPKTPSTPTNKFPRTPIGSSSLGPKSHSLLNQFSSSKASDSSSNRAAEKMSPTSPSPASTPLTNAKPTIHIVMIDEVLPFLPFFLGNRSLLRLMHLGRSERMAPCRSGLG